MDIICTILLGLLFCRLASVVACLVARLFRGIIDYIRYRKKYGKISKKTRVLKP